MSTPPLLQQQNTRATPPCLHKSNPVTSTFVRPVGDRPIDLPAPAEHRLELLYLFYVEESGLGDQLGAERVAEESKVCYLQAWAWAAEARKRNRSHPSSVYLQY